MCLYLFNQIMYAHQSTALRKMSMALKRFSTRCMSDRKAKKHLQIKGRTSTTTTTPATAAATTVTNSRTRMGC